MLRLRNIDIPRAAFWDNPTVAEINSRLVERDALRNENEELKAQNLLIRGDNADLLANADAYSFNISNMHTKMLQLLEENEELRKDAERYRFIRDNADTIAINSSLQYCDIFRSEGIEDGLDIAMKFESDYAASVKTKESEASHE